MFSIMQEIVKDELKKSSLRGKLLCTPRIEACATHPTYTLFCKLRVEPHALRADKLGFMSK